MRRFGRRLAIWLFFLAIPFVMLSWLAPFVTRLTIGNDYAIYSLGAQLDAMWSVWKGTFPLYMPGFASGHSTASMTLGQLYHPLSWISSVMPGYWHGLALEWNTFFRLLSLGFTHLFLFKLCRRLSVSPLYAFLATFPVVYNLRMLDSFRYGASVEAYTGMLLAATAAGFVFLDSERKRPVALLGVSTYLLAVSGHPQWAFFGLLGAGLFALLFPWVAAAVHPDFTRLPRKPFFAYILRLTVGFGTGLLLAAPYLLTFYFEYFRTNHSRAENAYQWTLGYADSLRGEASNFLFPLHADVHGAFAGSALYLIAALFPIAALVKRPPRVLWIAYALGLLAFLFAVGKESWVHPFMVKYVPAFGSFRVPGRIVIWIPLFAFPIWAWMLRADKRPALRAAAAVAFALFASNWLWTTNSLPAQEWYSPHKIWKTMPPYLDSFVLYTTGATLLFLVFAVAYKRFSRRLFVLSVVSMMLTTWLCLFAGTWRTKKGAAQTFDQIAAARKASVTAHSDPGYGMETRTVTEYKQEGLSPTRDLGTILHHVEQVGSEGEILKRLKTKARGLPLFLDRPVATMSPDAVADKDEVKLVYNTSNRFLFSVTAAEDGYFVLGQAWLPGFACKLDGATVDVARANVLFPAIFVPKGPHQVDFRFISWPFLAGVALCFLTVWGWAFGVFRGRKLRVLLAGVLSFAALAALLYLSLLRGPSFETTYHWEAKLDPARRAL
jgi:hypothetical protein